ncbi:MAG: hypothetical protein ACP5QO_15835 [Clostridia bacterium]
MASARPKDQRRADYFLYTWQIRAIRHLAEERHEAPSQVVRELLNEALRAPQPERPAEKLTAVR